MRLLSEKPFKVKRNTAGSEMLRTNISSKQTILKENGLVYEYQFDNFIAIVPEEKKEEFENEVKYQF